MTTTTHFLDQFLFDYMKNVLTTAYRMENSKALTAPTIAKAMKYEAQRYVHGIPSKCEVIYLSPVVSSDNSASVCDDDEDRLWEQWNPDTPHQALLKEIVDNSLRWFDCLL